MKSRKQREVDIEKCLAGDQEIKKTVKLAFEILLDIQETLQSLIKK